QEPAKTSGGDDTHNATAELRPQGSNNDIFFEASTAGEDFNGITIRLLDGAEDNEISVKYNQVTKVLTILVEYKVTTAEQFIAAVNAEGTFTALLDTSEETGNSGQGFMIQDLIAPIDFDSLGTDALDKMEAIINAGFIEGYSKLRMFGIDLGETFIEGTIKGIAAEADIPWLMGLQARFEAGWKTQSGNQMLFDMVSSPLISTVLQTLGITGDPAQAFSFLLDDAMPDTEVYYPVAGFEATMSSDRVFEWLGDSFGLPDEVVKVATDLSEINVFFGAYTPGYGGPDDAGVKRNGGFRLDVDLDIEGLVDDAEFEFEVELFSFLESTDLATFLIPNFRASAYVPSLYLPGFEPDSPLLSMKDFFIEIVKDSEGLSLKLDGVVTVLGLKFDADGEFELNSQGIYGGLLLVVNTTEGGIAETLGFEIDGFFSLEINFTDAAQIIIRTVDGLPVEVTIEHGLRIHIDGKVSLFDSFIFDGEFDLVLDEGALSMDLNAKLIVVFDSTTVFEFTVDASSNVSFMRITEKGIAGAFQLKRDTDDILPLSDYGLNLEAIFFLTINTTEEAAAIILRGINPVIAYSLNEDEEDRLNNGDIVLLSDNISTLKKDLTSGEITLTIPNTPGGQVDGEGALFVLLHADGQLKFPGFDLNGSFDFEFDDNFAVMSADAQLLVDFDIPESGDTLTLLNLQAGGVLLINEDGFAGKMKLGTEEGLPSPFSELGIDGLNFGADASFDLLLNTTRSNIEIQLPDRFDVLNAFHVPEERDDDPVTDLNEEINYLEGVLLDDNLTTLKAEDVTLPDNSIHRRFMLTIPNS
ncbi:hypothetical protein ACFLZG_07880, partial [Thermodesulfobacteriota bacterium]